MRNLRKDAKMIINDILPFISCDNTFEDALKDFKLPKGNLYLVAVGKATFNMTARAEEILHGHIKEGIVLSKYWHINGDIPNIKCYEANHPLIDENGIKATKKILEMASNLYVDDMVLFLLSEGGTTLFEDSLISLNELIDINSQLIRIRQIL